MRTAVRALQVATLALGVVLAGLFVTVVVARFLYPVEVEWMTGAICDGIARVRDGKPLYAEPSAEFIAFLYPPLYYWAAGLLARLTSASVAGKLVSLAAAFASGVCVARIAKVLGASRFWIACSVLLHVGAYSLTLFFYDLERVDVLESTLVVIALVLLLEGETTARAVAGGALLGLAYFAKQPGLLAFLAAVAGLAFAGQRRRAAVVACSGGVVLVALSVYLHVTTRGWFWFYTWSLPRLHGFDGRYVSSFLVVDTPRAFLLVGATIAFAIAAVKRRHEWRDVTFGAVLVAAMVSAASMRAHRGGYPNVLLAWTPLACAAAGVVASRAIERTEEGRGRMLVEILLASATCFQLLGWVFDPNDVAPGPTDLRREKALRAYVEELERDGEVLVATTGNLTRVRHYHSAALYDIVDASFPPPPDVARAFSERRFATVLFGVHDDPPCKAASCKELRDIVMRNYFVAAYIHRPPDRSDRHVGFDGRARWVLRARKTPLPATTPEKTLAALRKEEIALAVAHGHRVEDEEDFPLPDDTIEQRAAAR